MTKISVNKRLQQNYNEQQTVRYELLTAEYSLRLLSRLIRTALKRSASWRWFIPLLHYSKCSHTQQCRVFL